MKEFLPCTVVLFMRENRGDETETPKEFWSVESYDYKSNQKAAMEVILKHCITRLLFFFFFTFSDTSILTTLAEGVTPEEATKLRDEVT